MPELIKAAQFPPTDDWVSVAEAASAWVDVFIASSVLTVKSVLHDDLTHNRSDTRTNSDIWNQKPIFFVRSSPFTVTLVKSGTTSWALSSSPDTYLRWSSHHSAGGKHRNKREIVQTFAAQVCIGKCSQIVEESESLAAVPRRSLPLNNSNFRCICSQFVGKKPMGRRSLPATKEAKTNRGNVIVTNPMVTCSDVQIVCKGNR